MQSDVMSSSSDDPALRDTPHPAQTIRQQAFPKGHRVAAPNDEDPWLPRKKHEAQPFM